MTADDVTIRLDDKRRTLVDWWQKLQQVIGGVPLLLAGIHRLRAPGASGHAFALAEIVVASALLAMFVRDLRARARARLAGAAPSERVEHPGPEWFDVVAGVLLILEAVNSTHPGGKPLYQHAILYLGAITLLTGLASGALAARRSRRTFIRIDDAGVHAHLTRFRRVDVSWSALIDVEIRDDAVVLVSNAGRKRIPLRRYGNASEIRAALTTWKERKARAHARALAG